MKLTVAQLAEMIPNNVEVYQWFCELDTLLPKYQINTARRVAHFISQCAHESNNFRSLEENLNYSESALLSVFGRYFGDPPKRNAAEYARKPEKIANYVYMDQYRLSKMGNTQPGDGWLFRGRGLKQLTGRDNYTQFGKSVGLTAEQAAEYVATKRGAVESACWYWHTHNLNVLADADNATALTKKINGGLIGFDDRLQRYNAAIAVINNPGFATPKQGSKGELVKLVQAALYTRADGDFGPATGRALTQWQAKHGLPATGVADNTTLEKLIG
jgi:putative chitinase